MFELIISAISSFLLLVLSVYLILKQRTIINAALSFPVFLLALIEILDQASMHLSYDPVAIKRAVIFLESLLPATFLFFSITYSRQRSDKSNSILWKVLTGAAILFPAGVFMSPADNFFYSPDFRIERMLFLGEAGYWFYIGVMIYCVLALMNLEATFSATSGTDRWRMKFEMIGMSSILAVLIFYFSQGLLYRAINMNLIPVRSGVFIIASILVGYSKLFRGNGVSVMVSRYILYRSFTLIMAGLYLLILGLIGEGMKYFDIAFNRDIAIFIAFSSGIAMLLILFSEQLRRRAKVFINKHFYAHKHEYRDEWLKFTGRLSSCNTIEDVLNAILTTYKETFGLKGSSIYLLDKETGGCRLAVNHDMPGRAIDMQASSGLISYFVDRGRVLNPLDGEYALTSEEDSFVRKTGARLIIPLVDNGGLEGFVVLGEQIARDEFTYEDYDLMKTLARQAVLSILNFKLSEELAETREIAAVARISSFVIHDLKNLTSTLSLLLDNAENYIGDPEFQNDMIETIRNSLKKMRNLIQRLKTIPEKDTLNIELSDIHLLAKDTVEDITKTRQSANIIYKGSSVLSMVDPEEIKKVVLNLILNAIDALGKGGMVEVETGINGGNSYIRVRDDGCGMEKEFIDNHLFKPFRTTKKKGLGIGLYQCKQIVDAHSGRISVNSEVEKGTAFTVYLPLAKESAYVMQY
jgi:putative PEP-CTERM system histidine kinase